VALSGNGDRVSLDRDDELREIAIADDAAESLLGDEHRGGQRLADDLPLPPVWREASTWSLIS
jgi:hypothetical protein